MLIWFALIIPVLLCVYLLVYHPRQVLRWELVVPFAATVLFVGLAKWTVELCENRSTEYLSGYFTDVWYFERWDEEVSCRHPIYCENCYGTGEDRTCTRVVCGYRHSYDVDEHSPYWEAHDNNGFTFRVHQNLFEGLAKDWGERKFVDQHRDYHSIDGDSFVSRWNGKDETLFAVTTTHNYENKVARSSGVFGFSSVTAEEKKQFELFDYPPIKNFRQASLLGYDSAVGARALDILNAKLGRLKQVKVFVLVYRSKSITASLMQESYWKGGNKNELVLTTGLDSEGKVQWGRTFSWTDKALAKVESTSLLEAQIGKPLDVELLVRGLYTVIDQYWVRKDFKDFDYLTVEPSSFSLTLVYFLTILVNVGVGYWLVKNEYFEPHHFTR